jgi:cytidylate kinase
MKAIRGATTVAQDDKEQIRTAVSELLTKMKDENALDADQIVCILFSNTADIHSFYPAKAAREAGFAQAALFSALEPPIDQSLPLCIRVMMLVETDEKVKHIYLRGAATLRNDLSQKLNIAIDGPAGSGKSTVAKILAKEFDILYLDTGAMYRACALECIKKGIDLQNEREVSAAVAQIDLKINYQNGSQITLLNGVDVSQTIRQPEVSQRASVISAYSAVREKMVSMQRKIADEMSCVLDGRDIGTVVLPHSPYKFFITASAEERANRRYKELLERGFNQPYDVILNEIKERDYRDEHRAVSPLKQAEDAAFIDTSNLTINEVVALVKRKIQEKI